MDTSKYTENVKSIQKLTEDLNASVKEQDLEAYHNLSMPTGKIIITTAIIVIVLIVLVSYWGVLR